jgi:MFS family permease
MLFSVASLPYNAAFAALPHFPWFPAFSVRPDTPMIALRLSVMMFLQFFIWGSWYVTAYLFLEKIGFGPTEISWTYSVGPIAGMISPFFVGMVADRFFSTERVLGVMHLLGAAAMAGAITMMGGATPEPIVLGGTTISIPAISLTENASPLAINLLFFGYMLCFFPTLALTNSLALHTMTNAEKQFPLIRVFGTIGWIVAGILVSWQGWDAAVNLFYLATAFSVVMGLYSFTLPHTPPPSKGAKVSVKEVLGLDALVLLKRPAFLTFIVSSFLICIPLAFYYQMAGKFVDQAGQANPAFKMTFGQMSEIFFMLVMPLFFARLGVKWMLFVGMLAWVVRYALFATAANPMELTGVSGVDTVLSAINSAMDYVRDLFAGGVGWMVIGGIVLHGICYDFFFVTGQIYTDKAAPPAIRSQAQGLLVLFTLGVGMFIGAQFAGYIENRYTSPEETRVPLEERANEIAAQMDDLESQIVEIRGEGVIALMRMLLGMISESDSERIAELEKQVADLREERSDLLLQTVDWRWVWGIPCGIAAVIMLAFVVLFRDVAKPKETFSELEAADAPTKPAV